MKDLPRVEQLRLYEQLVDNMTNGVCIIKADDEVVVYTNSQFDALFSLNRAEIQKIHASELFVFEEHPQGESYLNVLYALKNDGVWQGELLCADQKGLRFWCYVNMSTFCHSVYGKVYLGIYADITEKIEVRQQLNQMEVLLKSSIESPSDVTIVSIDKDFNYLYFNDAHRVVMNAVYGVDIAVGDNILECITEENDRQLAKKFYTKALSGGRFSHVDEYGVPKFRFYFETDYNPIYNASNEIIGAAAFAKEITQRRRTEIALRESEERFKKLSDLSQEGIFIHNDGICIDVNKAFERIVGYSKSDLVGKDLIDVLVVDEFKPIVKMAIQSSQFSNYEILVKHKDGKVLNVEITGRRRIRHNGEKAYVSVARDLTENKTYQLKVKRSEADLAAQIENTSDAIWSVDGNYRMTVSNTNFIHNFYLAYQHELKVGERILDYLPAELKAEWKKRYDRALQGEHFSVIDEFNYDSLTHFVESSFNAVRVDGKIVGVACFTKDITKQKVAERDLKFSEEKLKKLLELSPAAISIQNYTTYFYVNSAWEQLTGYTKEEASRISPYDVVHPEVREKTRLRSASNFLKEGDEDRFDLKIQTKNGEIKWGDMSIVVMMYDNQLVTFSVIVDVTELRMAQKELLDSKNELNIANATKNKFFSIIAHDLKSPFSSILSLLTFITNEYDHFSDEERRNFLDSLLSTANKTYSLLDNLLNWAKAQLGGIKIKKVELNINRFIDRAIDPYLSIAKEKNIILNINVLKSNPLWADEFTLLTVIRNLFNNAIKYTHQGGRIDITYDCVESTSIIEIRDDGVGLSQKQMDQLFQLDESISTPGTNDEQGTGLGLILSNDFVKLNKGCLLVESSPERGSIFKVCLPNKPD